MGSLLTADNFESEPLLSYIALAKKKLQGNLLCVFKNIKMFDLKNERKTGKVSLWHFSMGNDVFKILLIDLRCLFWKFKNKKEGKKAGDTF